MIIAGFLEKSRGNERKAWHHVEGLSPVAVPSRKDLRRKPTDYCRRPVKAPVDFKETMALVFDDLLPKWNYRALPQRLES
jgi:hypothetical protein